MKIVYKPCRKKDLLPAFKMIHTSLNHLRKNTGKEPIRRRIRRLVEVEHLYGLDRSTFWCAWAGGNIIGFAAALIRGKQWYLAFLFVHPRYQDKGVGRELMQRVWRNRPGMSHSLSTFAFNMQAVGIYSKFGMAPLNFLPIMELDLAKFAPPEPSGLKIQPCSSRHDLSWIIALDRKIRGYGHPQEWRFWSKYDKAKIYIFKNRGKRVGYSMVYKQGFIGPAGAVSNEYLTKIVSDSIGLLKPKDKRIRINCPTVNLNLYRYLIGLGFRLLEMDIFMSDRSYADFQHYVPAQLAIF